MFWGRFLAIWQNFKQSLKHANTLINHLKCYFERNNKVSDFTEKALGFVYKNSKWSDLKNDNVKPTFKLQLKSIFGTILGWFVTLFILSHPFLKLSRYRRTSCSSSITLHPLFRLWLVSRTFYNTSLYNW